LRLLHDFIDATGQVDPVYRSSDPDGLRVAYVHIPTLEETKKTLLIVPGFSESHYKYSEIVSRFHEKGFSIYVINLRGMGYSQRYPKPKKMDEFLHRQIVHLNNGKDYALDLEYLYEEIILPNLKNDDFYIFAHSTGGLATVDFMANYPKAAKSVVLNSPLFGINMNWKEDAVSSVISPTLSEEWPPIGSQSIWRPEDATFESQSDTTSSTRWEHYNNFLRKNFDIAQAHPSRKWILKMVEATSDESLSRIAKGIRVPTLLLQAGKDTYVDISMHNLVKNMHEEYFGTNGKVCLKVNYYPQENHSIWRGSRHREVFDLILSHFSDSKCD
jgi:lysophospholipase